MMNDFRFGFFTQTMTRMIHPENPHCATMRSSQMEGADEARPTDQALHSRRIEAIDAPPHLTSCLCTEVHPHLRFSKTQICVARLNLSCSEVKVHRECTKSSVPRAIDCLRNHRTASHRWIRGLLTISKSSSKSSYTVRSCTLGDEDILLSNTPLL